MNVDIKGAPIYFEIPILGGIPITATLVVTWVIMLILTGLSIWLTHDLKVKNVSKRQAVAEFGPDRVAVGVDARDGRVRTAGWQSDSGLDYLEFVRQMEQIGVRKIIFTDIATDGMLAGPSYGSLKSLQDAVDCDIIASGGVSCNEDLVRLHQMGLYGAIVGKAYYAGAVDLARAVKEAGEQC